MHQVTPDQRLRSAEKEHREKIKGLRQSILTILNEKLPPESSFIPWSAHKDDQLTRIRKIVEE